MTNIKLLNDRIIFDGHADTKQECETITLMCDNLAKSKDFKTVKYESGYAEFEKVGQSENLMFVPSSGIRVQFIVNGISENLNIGLEWMKLNDMTTGTATIVANSELNFVDLPSGIIRFDTTASGYAIKNVEIESQTDNNCFAGRSTLNTFRAEMNSEGALDYVITLTFVDATPTTKNITMVFDSGITSVTTATSVGTYTWTESNTTKAVSGVFQAGISLGFDITFKNNYDYNTVTVDGTTVDINDSGEFVFTPTNTNASIITITTKKYEQTIDVSTLSGWDSLASGNHQITVKTKASGYEDSASSNAVSVTKAASGYSVAISGWNGYGLSIYDGTSDSGTLLAEVSSGSDEPTTVICQSGNLFLHGAFATYRLGDTTTVTGGVTIISEDDNSYKGTFKVTGDGTITLDIYCFIEGTQITLADGTKKAIEDITYDDELLVWNFYEGKFDKAKPTWIKVEQIAPRYNLVKFSNGAEVGFVGAGDEKGYHRIFNKEKGAFTYTGNLKETPNGTTTFAEDSTFPTVISQEIVNKEVKFYNVITDKHYNLFANGVLTSCKLSNKYRIENMKYIGDKLITDEEEKRYFEAKNKLRK